MAYGCTTCIGNSGPLPAAISARHRGASDLVVASVLSGNRNFEGRVHPEVRANYLMSPPLVVAFALAGRVDIDFDSEPLGTDKDGKPVFLQGHLADQRRGQRAWSARPIKPEMYSQTYARVFEGDASGRACRCRTGRPTPGIRPRPTSSTRPTSRA